MDSRRPPRLIQRSVSFEQIGFYQRNAMLARVLAMTLCRRLSVTSRCSTEMDGRIQLVLACRLLSTYPTLCCKETHVSAKITVVPSGTLSHTLDLEKLATTSRPCCQQNSSTVEFVDDTYVGRRVVAVYCKLVNCNPLSPHPRSVVDLLLTRFRLTRRVVRSFCDSRASWLDGYLSDCYQRML